MSVPSYKDWLDHCVIGQDGSHKPNPLGLGVEDKVSVPASYIRQAIVEEIEGRVKIHSGLRAEGFIFTGDLHIENLTINFPMYLKNCVFEGSLYVWRLKSKTISLIGSHVAGGIDFRTSTIEGHLLLRDGFECEGPILARDMTVSSSVDLSRSNLVYDGDRSKDFGEVAKGEVFGFTRSSAGALYWKDLQSKPKAGVNFRDAKVGALLTDFESGEKWRNSWPDKGGLILEGFEYTRFTTCSVGTALAWLDLQETIEPSSYSSLAKAFEYEHSPSKVEEVLARAKKAEIASIEKPTKRYFHKAVFWLVGYGKAPEKALVIFLLLMAAHYATVAGLAYNSRFEPNTNSFLMEPCFFGPSEECKKDLTNWTEHRVEPAGIVRYLPPAYPNLSVHEYALETFLPVFEFGQASYWQPSDFVWRLLLSLFSVLGLFIGGVFFGSITGLINPKPK